MILLISLLISIPVLAAEEDDWLNEEVIFNNKEIEDEARKDLLRSGVNTEGRKLTRDDIRKVINIVLNGPLQNKNLSELSLFPSIRSIEIVNEPEIDDWSFLEYGDIKESLIEINIRNCDINDNHQVFSHLGGWPRLNGILILDRNQISSLSFLESMEYNKISLLSLSLNPIEDIYELNNFDTMDLRNINLVATPISDIKPLIIWAREQNNIIKNSDLLGNKSRPPNEQIFADINHCIYLDYNGDSPTVAELAELKTLCKLYACPDPLIVLNQPGITVPVTGVSLNSDNIELSPGQEQKLEYIITPEDATVKTVRLISSAPDIAEISRDGIITAKNPGETQISVQTLNKGFKAICNVTVYDNTIPRDQCFIATAAFGSKFNWPVVLLRQFRDQYLLTNTIGTKFVELYYRYSPPIAAVITDNEPLKVLTRLLLSPVIAVVYGFYHPLLLGLVFFTGACICQRKRLAKNLI